MWGTHRASDFEVDVFAASASNVRLDLRLWGEDTPIDAHQSRSFLVLPSGKLTFCSSDITEAVFSCLL